MPVYPRKKRNQWLVRIHVGGDPLTRTVTGTKREAEKVEARWRLELEAAGPADPKIAPRFSAFCLGRYQIHAEHRLAPGTWRNRKYQIATLIEFFGDKPLDKITAADVEAFQHHRAQSIGAVKINDDTKVLTAILNYARRQGIPCNVPKITRLPERKRRGRVVVWTSDEVDLLYKAMQTHSPRQLPLTVAMLNAGLRRGEVIALRWSNVDLKRGLLEVHPCEDWQPKNGKPREIPIGSALRPWLEVERESKVWVFPSQAGGRYVSWPQRAWDRGREAAGIGGSPHVCRHTFASHFLTACPDLFLLAQILGHSHTRVTELYSHLLPDYLDRARDAVCFRVPLGTISGYDPDTILHGKTREHGKSGRKRR